ncbi:MAG: radical SAM protein [Candidatus Aminicenantes bacterium]|nr:radical SAM protein [Flavobacteriaceae bacterium]MDH5744241.1 radical SAM protein [Candidatus Aminicenantes bacterium]
MSGVKKLTSGTKEWADFNVNCISGCANNCRYCYAKMTAKRFGRCTEESWKEMKIRKKDVEKNYKKYNGRVMFPSSHDIVNILKIKEACFLVLEKLLLAGNDVLVTTKPNLSVTKEIIKLFKQYNSQIQFRFTITSTSTEILSFWEPNAPSYEERLESLIFAYKEGYKTSVSIEPFLDKEPQNLVHQVAPYITESIWIGPMNYIPRKNISEEDQLMYEAIRENVEISHLKEIYENLKDFTKIRFKDSMKIKLGLM